MLPIYDGMSGFMLPAIHAANAQSRIKIATFNADLSPMQARAIARRCEHGSITLLGDLAQGTAPWATSDWRETLGHLGKPDAAVVPLTTGFRVPELVIALANRLLPALGVDVPEAVSLRRDGDLAIIPVEPADLDAATLVEVTAALEHEGSVAVIAADRVAVGSSGARPSSARALATIRRAAVLSPEKLRSYVSPIHARGNTTARRTATAWSEQAAPIFNAGTSGRSCRR